MNFSTSRSRAANKLSKTMPEEEEEKERSKEKNVPILDLSKTQQPPSLRRLRRRKKNRTVFSVRHYSCLLDSYNI
ncbi:hypothetical protein CEXT_456061 [Caerostris extrusa]|uniref:Uncharacterized protein n=1 Tax=Caerostris extrusa TaxID=172846 RepID=A0AAV4YFK8_CAEEX|nr:hypothetical protein CEXT_456061 [Caerostris extrusa]